MLKSGEGMSENKLGNTEDNSKKLKLEITKDNLEAYLIVDYSVEDETAMEGKASSFALYEDKKAKNPLEGSNIREEVKKLFDSYKIKSPVLEEAFKKGFKCPGKYLIAKGMPPIDDIPDKVVLRFKGSSTEDSLNADGAINYKEFSLIESVLPGQKIAELIKGSEGRDGNDVFGRNISRKRAKLIIFKAGRGCVLQPDGSIIASIAGKPSYKSGLIEVNEIYEHKNDVDIQSGSIKFSGNVKIYGSVMPGMKVDAGGDVEILGSVEEAEITSLGSINIKGSVLRSKITAGGGDNSKLTFIKLYNDIASSLKDMVSSVEEIKRYGLLGSDRSDGQIIKALLDSKFKNIEKLSKEVLILYKKTGLKEETIEKVLQYKLIGLAPLGIKNYKDLLTIGKLLLGNISKLKEELSYKSYIRLNYCQDSDVLATGDIYIVGKGLYQSRLKAGENIIFSGMSAVRGGSISARERISCITVGSPGGVVTRLEVEKEGEILVEKSYQNTHFILGEKEMLLDIPSKKVHAYIGKDGLVNIDKFNM